MTNPFAVFSPESLAPDVVVELFVENSPGVDSIQSNGHSMLVGSRGAGKSMILRYMEPDCQRLVAPEPSAGLNGLRYYTAYLTVRETELSLPELTLLNGSFADLPLNEHLLVLTVGLSILTRALRNKHFSDAAVEPDVLNAIARLRALHTVDSEDWTMTASTENAVLDGIVDWLTGEHAYAMRYFSTLRPGLEAYSFDRRLFRFAGFLAPFIALLRQFPSMPRAGAFYLAIDDADRLSESQTRILNTWLSRRTSEFSIKVSYEMYGYKTFYTTIQTRIEAPHDYQEIRVSDVYTSNKKLSYRDRMRQMIGRRLTRAGIVRGKHDVPDVDTFFPEDSRQSIAIENLRKKRRSEIERVGGKSARIRDDLYRYVLPDYILSLGGSKKSRSTYRYSGFDQLVDISSGVPRYFLEAAQKMYDRQIVRSASHGPVREITPEVQDSVVRDLASELFMEELEKLRIDMRSPDAPDFALMLHNLVGSLGAWFERIMYDASASERRIFSFAVSDQADEQVAEVLRLGLRHAFFSRSSIGRKEGFGRTERYVLSRRFAPYWNLDPSGFSAYKFVTNADLKLMMLKPEQFRLKLRRGDMPLETEDGQLEIPLSEEK